MASPEVSSDNIQTYFLRDAESNSSDDTPPDVIQMPFPFDFLMYLLSSWVDWSHRRSNLRVCTKLHLKQKQVHYMLYHSHVSLYNHLAHGAK